MTRLILILGDQLSDSISSLQEYNPKTDIILMCEVWIEATYVKHHKKKIAFLFSAMRHFAERLTQNGHRVLYIKLDDPNNTGSFKGEIERVIKSHHIDHVVVTHPGEHRVLADIQTWETKFQIPIEIKPDERFLCSQEKFSAWAKGRKQMRMEYFYREMRKQYSVLMQDDLPIGGQWNYDSQNRQPPKEGLNLPAVYQTDIDDITSDVLNLVEKHFDNHFGDLQPFHYAVTREQALEALDMFIRQRLPYFGDYQDAMLQGEPWMYHSHISFYLNCGLLLPLECIRAAEAAYHQGIAPLNAIEGFIRQILGWREYVRGIYWLKMPEYASANFFNASRNLPEFYWTANTKMNCLRQCVLETKENAYAHHIQRLMVLGNFALIASIDPAQVNEWFLIVYADAYEWVELPNVTGMILFADGGYLASKPYAAGGAYINKMSNYCKNCRYSVTKKTGPDACPFNYLYWHFLEKNRSQLESNHRIGMMYRIFDKMAAEKQKQVQTDSTQFFEKLKNGIVV